MKPFFILSILLATAPVVWAAENDQRRANTVVLDDTGVKNLRIQTVVTEPGEFEETVFALGRIDVYPGNRAAISSPIPGRALEVRVKHDHVVKKDAAAFVIESRQPGNPPPRITLAAPISGHVSAVNVIAGQPVSPDTALAEIIDLEVVYALARVPEHLAGRLKKGLVAHVRVPAAPDVTYEATLEHLGALADPVSGTVEAAFHIDNPELKLRPGMRAEFSIVTAKRENVTMVPRVALQGNPNNRFVYVKDFDVPNAFVKTPVVVGQSNDRFVEIVGGLLPADEVVTRGAYSLAFAGAGSISLKEALDAAHGHSHNEDGSEKGSSAGGASSDHGHDHGDGDDGHAHPERVWMIISGVLLVALVVVAFRKRNLNK